MSLRLDVFLTRRGDTESRRLAQELIKGGFVSVNGQVITKAAHPIENGDEVFLQKERVCPYVSRGGYKLEAALSGFMVDVRGMVCADLGASSGGFTDCLLQRGAARVYAIDSGHGQLHPSLLQDKRVISREGCNARYLSQAELPELVDLVVMDVSFISQTKLFGALVPLMKHDGLLVSLIKPQFEVGPGGIGKGGIVRDEKKRREAVETVVSCAEVFSLRCEAVMPSPIRGGDGNVEFLACFQKMGTEIDRKVYHEN